MAGSYLELHTHVSTPKTMGPAGAKWLCHSWELASTQSSFQLKLPLTPAFPGLGQTLPVPLGLLWCTDTPWGSLVPAEDGDCGLPGHSPFLGLPSLKLALSSCHLQVYVSASFKMPLCSRCSAVRYPFYYSTLLPPLSSGLAALWPSSSQAQSKW